MKLEKAFRYATLSVVTALIIFSFVVARTISFSLHSARMEKQSLQIRNSVFDFYSLVTDHIQHPKDPRPLLQWKAAYDQLDKLIVQARTQSKDDEEKEILLNIQNSLRQMNHLFSRFPEFFHNPTSARLSSPLLLEQMHLQSLRILNLANLMTKAREEAANTLIRISLPMIIIFLLGVIAFIVAVVLWSHVRLLNPLKSLKSSAEKIQEGDLAYPLNLPQEDEIGALSKTLHEMKEHLLESQKQIASEAREKLAAQHELLDIQEMERKRIGQDLHDSIAQRLAGISFMSQALVNKLSQKDAPEAVDLRSLTDEIRKALEETRQLSHSFHPMDLEHSGLVPALRNFAETTESAFRVTCHFICTEEFSLEDPDTSAHLYRIAQEAVHNAIRHGKAKEIRMTFGKHLTEAILEIADNGTGFSPGSNEMENGIGFKSMRYRAALIHGRLSVESPKDHGTRITVRCPLKLPHLHPNINSEYHIDFNPNKDRFF